MDTKKKNTKLLDKKNIEAVKTEPINLSKIVNTDISTDGTVKRKRNRRRKTLKKENEIINVDTEKVIDTNPSESIKTIKAESKPHTNQILVSPPKSDDNKHNEIIKEKENNIVLLSPKVSADAAVESKAPIAHITSSNMQPTRVEKTKEEVKAEREAKKLAKQLAKNKKKDADDNKTDLKENIDEKKKDVQNKTKPAVENKISTETDKINKENVTLKPKNKKETPITNVEKSTIDQNEENKNIALVPDNQNAAQNSKKSELRAERRAIQEAQRNAKLLAVKVASQKEEKRSKSPKTTEKKPEKKTTLKKRSSFVKTAKNNHRVKLFNHLYTNIDDASIMSLNLIGLHPAIVSLGLKYASHAIIGSNARCIAFLNTMKQVIDDYILPPNEEFSRGFEAFLTPCMHFLAAYRPLAVSMNNALKHIKLYLTQFDNSISENDAKLKLKKEIDEYILNQIEKAGEAISHAVINKITDGDVILTYGCSSLIEYILVNAATKEGTKKKFRVVVVVANPWNEGREMLRRLSAKGIKCSLVMISALSFIMREIKLVVLGAGALLANGYVMARAGTAQVALVANAHNVPVLVCCETYKFSERVQTDSFVYNEIGDPDDLVKCYSTNTVSPLINWRNLGTLTPLNLMYDVTPPELVTAVFTERAVIPCTSVPVILRLKPEVLIE